MFLGAGGWELGIGDPTVLGWAITLAYAVGVWFTLRAGAHAIAGHGTKPVGVSAPISEGLIRFWLFASVVLLLLGLNKQLDLQTLFTASAREIAKQGGWYRGRKPIQYAVLAGSLFAAMGVSVWILWVLRRFRGLIWSATIGIWILSAYVVMRGTSHHDVDAWMRAGPVSLKDSMELVGIALITWPAWRFSVASAGQSRV